MGDPLGVRDLPSRERARLARARSLREGLRKGYCSSPTPTRVPSSRPIRARTSGTTPRRRWSSCAIRPTCGASRCGASGSRNIRPGEPVALLQERFAPALLLAPLRHQLGVEGDRWHGVQQRGASATGSRRRGPSAPPVSARRSRCSSPGCSPPSWRSPTRCSRCSAPRLLVRTRVGRAVRHAHAPGVRRAGRGAHARADDRGRRAAARACRAARPAERLRRAPTHARRDDRRARRRDVGWRRRRRRRSWPRFVA